MKKMLLIKKYKNGNKAIVEVDKEQAEFLLQNLPEMFEEAEIKPNPESKKDKDNKEVRK